MMELGITSVLIVAATAGALLLLVRRWLTPGWRRWRQRRNRARLEDALKHLLDLSQRGQTGSLEALAGALRLPPRKVMPLVSQMEHRGLVISSSGSIKLTEQGEERAIQVVRAHRLWERYLADEARLALSKIHHAAERAEHQLTTQRVDALEAHLGHPRHDPHGDPIPQADGALPPLDAVPLTDWKSDGTAYIAHVEDEPEAVFRKILDLGLEPGQAIRVVEHRTDAIVLTDGEREYRLAPIMAANIHVRAEPVAPRMPAGAVPLSQLPDRAQAEVVGIDSRYRGFGRRRLLDLGLTRGARVSPELTNSFGDPRAYRVRGTLIALRREQARFIWVRPLAPAGSAAATPGVSR